MIAVAIVAMIGLVVAVAYAVQQRAAAESAGSALREAEGKLERAEESAGELAEMRVEMRGREEQLSAARQRAEDRERDLTRTREEQKREREAGAKQTSEQSGELKALQERIKQFERKQEEVAASTLEAAGSNKRIESTLLDWTRQIANPQGRGAFGELALQNQLTSLGLEEGRDFRRQARPGTDGLQRVDFIVQAGGPTVAIDSKLANDPGLSGLSDALAAGDDESLKTYGRKLRDHAKALAGKDYWRELDRSPSLTLMYVPVEGATHALSSLDEFDLAKFFNTHRVCVITPSQLALSLILIAELAHAERKEEHVEELLSRGHTMAEAMANFLQNYAKLGNKLRESVNAFNGGAAMTTTHGQVWQQVVKPLSEFTPSKSIDPGVKELETPRDDVIDLAERYREAGEQMRAESDAA